MPATDLRSERRARLAAAQLYMVCSSIERSANVRSAISAPPDAASRPLADLLRPAIAGGVQVVQLRDKLIPDDELVAPARAARVLCEGLGALLIVNDRPLLAREVGADGVHVGQEDMPVAEVRELLGPDMLIGLSTHATDEIDAATATAADGTPLVDYIGVGPVHETPTKPGRPAVGLELVRYAAANSAVPFFAIGGLHAGNIHEVLAAGASRVVVLRAIAAAEDPERAAGELRAELDRRPLEAGLARADA
jgi:thiamine-phosphate pyrophosphorylase